MGSLYDTFHGWDGLQIQLKVDPAAENRDYHIGESVGIADGVYAGYGGLVVVVGGSFVATFTEVHDKWGNSFKADDPAHENNPVVKALRRMWPDRDFSPE